MGERRFKNRRAADSEPAGSVLDLVSLATSKALDKRRRRLYGECAVLSILVSLAVSIPTAFIETQAASSNAMAQRNYNCRVATFIAAILGNGSGLKQLPEGGFISSDAYLRQTQAVEQAQIRGQGPLAVLLRDPETKRLEVRSATLNTRTVRYWRHTLIPYLNRVGRANCSRIGS